MLKMETIIAILEFLSVMSMIILFSLLFPPFGLLMILSTCCSCPDDDDEDDVKRVTIITTRNN